LEEIVSEGKMACCLIGAVLVIVVVLTVTSILGSKKSNSRHFARQLVCERTCKNHEGYGYQVKKREAFAGFNRYCVCWDGTQVPVPNDPHVVLH